MPRRSGSGPLGALGTRPSSCRAYGTVRVSFDVLPAFTFVITAQADLWLMSKAKPHSMLLAPSFAIDLISRTSSSLNLLIIADLTTFSLGCSVMKFLLYSSHFLYRRHDSFLKTVFEMRDRVEPQCGQVGWA